MWVSPVVAWVEAVLRSKSSHERRLRAVVRAGTLIARPTVLRESWTSFGSVSLAVSPGVSPTWSTRTELAGIAERAGPPGNLVSGLSITLFMLPTL